MSENGENVKFGFYCCCCCCWPCVAANYTIWLWHQLQFLKGHLMYARKSFKRKLVWFIYMYSVYAYLNAQNMHHQTTTLFIHYYLYISSTKKRENAAVNIMTTRTTTITHRIFFLSFFQTFFLSVNLVVKILRSAKYRTQCIASRSIISICGRKTFRILLANGNYFDRRQMFFPFCSCSLVGFGLTCMDCSSSLNFFSLICRAPLFPNVFTIR